MPTHASTFIDKSKAKAADLEHRKKINFNIGKYNTKEIDFICRKGSEKIYIHHSF